MITSRDEAFFNMARKVSKFSNWKQRKCQVGCIVVEKHRVISSGYNQDKTSPLQRKYNRVRFNADTPHTLHAEIDALSPLMRSHDVDFSKVSVYTYREKKNGKLGSSRPCQSCMKLIKDLGIRYIYYTTDDGYAEEVISY